MAAAIAAGASPVMVFKYALECRTENHIVVPDRLEFIETIARDTELQLLRS